MSKTQRLILQRAIGAIFTFAGFMNFFEFGEDIGTILATAAQSIHGTRLGALMQLVVKFDWWVIRLTGAFMFATGITQLLNLRFAQLAGIAQLCLMTGFIAVLHRAYPEVIFDGFLIIAIATLQTQTRAEVPA